MIVQAASSRLFLVRLTLVQLLLLVVLSGGTFSHANGPTASPFSADPTVSADSIQRTANGAQLHAPYQKLLGTVSPTGLRVTSLESEFSANGEDADFQFHATQVRRIDGNTRHFDQTGRVYINSREVLYDRAGITEEYSVSIDGIRQDFILPNRLAGEGELTLVLAVQGASVTKVRNHITLLPDNSTRELAYHRLQVVDADGTRLPASMVVAGPRQLEIRINDQDARYPIRIDPTYSDADWVSMSEVPGANDSIEAMVTDGVGNVYVGGYFTAIADTAASRVAKWDGNNWSALGAGLDEDVSSLLFADGTLYVGVINAPSFWYFLVVAVY